MPGRDARRLLIRLACLAGSLACVTDVTLAARASGDYQPGAPVAGDNAAPAIDALVHCQFAAFFQHQPLMGPMTLLLRAPAAWLATTFGGGEMWEYRAGALACLFSVALFAAWAAARTVLDTDWSQSRWRWPAAIALILLLTLSPTTRDSIDFGHPEGPFTGVLTIGAVLLAARGRAGLAGIALGLAIASKETALLAIPPVLLASGPGWRRTAAAVFGSAAALLGPAIIAHPDGIVRSASVLAVRNLVSPLSLWWPIGGPMHVGSGVSPWVHVLPDHLDRLKLALLLAVVAGVLYAAVRLRWPERSFRDPLALLVLFSLMRCLGDPLPQDYYYGGVVMTLAVWEVLALKRFPTLGLLSAVFVDAVPGVSVALSSPERYLISVLCAVSLAVYVVHRVFTQPDAWGTEPRAAVSGERTRQLLTPPFRTGPAS